MNSLLIPSSPNWYGSSAFVCSSTGTLVYCARNILVAIDPSPDDTPANIRILYSGKKEKITNVAVNPIWIESQKFIATTSEDKIVRLWDLETEKVKYAHDGHVNKASPAGVIFLDNNRVVSTAEDGFTVMWKLANNDFTTFTVNIGAKNVVSCISACPHLPGVAAYGLKKGIIYIVDLRKEGRIRHTLRGHHKEIISLSWCPQPSDGAASNPNEESKEQEPSVEGDEKTDKFTKYYLASAMRGGGPIKVWQISEEYKLLAELTLPSFKKEFNKDPWISLCWISAHAILASSCNGALLQYNWSLSNLKGQKPITVHTLHTKHLFGIAAPIPSTIQHGEQNWREKSPLIAWTMGHEQLVARIDINTKEIQSLYPCISGYVYCFAPSPIDPGRIAIGIGDMSLRIWNLNKFHSQKVEMTRLQSRHRLKITSLAWHPRKEDVLAFSSLEGQVGCVNPLSGTWKIFSPDFKGAVYKVEWGLLDGATALYAVGDGKIHIYIESKESTEPVKFTKLDKEYITQFAWKPDGSMLAVGTKLGYVTLFSSTFEQRASLYLQQKSVQCIAWHPEATDDESAPSPYCNYLAVATSNTDIPVYECNLEEADKVSEKLVAMLKGHTRAVRALAWNTHKGAELASCGDDGLVHVWDVREQTVVASWCSRNADVMMTVMWSPVDSDFIICGGRDICLNVWKVSTSPPKLQIEARTTEKEKVLKLEKEKHAEEVTLPKEVKSTKNSIRSLMLNELSKSQSVDSANVLDDCRLLLKRRTSNDDVQSVAENSERANPCQLFGSKDDVLQLLDLEKTVHMERSKNFCSQSIALWRGDLSTEIRSAMKNGTLSPWLISLAPSVSPKLWRDACEAYATYNVENAQGDPFYIASYFLACHKVDEAIRTLMRASLYREALALAKCRLHESDPLMAEILESWAAYSIRNGSFEIATQCFLVLGKLEEAAKALFRRSDVKSLEFCAEIAKECDNKDLLDAILFRLNAFKSEETADTDIPLPSIKDLIISQTNDNMEVKPVDSENNGTVV